MEKLKHKYKKRFEGRYTCEECGLVKRVYQEQTTYSQWGSNDISVEEPDCLNGKK